MNAWRPSDVEEVIAVLWSILFILLWRGEAPWPVLVLVGAKALGDHITAIGLAWRSGGKEG